MQSFEPIAAVSTPYGKGGIAVIRLSGEGAISVADRVFRAKDGRPLSELSGGRAVYGEILSDGRRIDDGIATVFRAPRSYTGEDTVEISCHGGVMLTEAVLGAVLAAGCRMARGGEFTKRAFLNGKIGLSEAEAVIGLIEASNEEQLRLSTAMAGGLLSRRMTELSQRLTTLIASVYAYMDYPDEDLTDLSPAELRRAVKALRDEVDALSATYRVGRAVSEGIPTVIVGKPNVGKSSLLNALLGYERAIVTDVAGTTRDTVEETVAVGRVTLRLCDTAGLRRTEDPVERLGVDRSLAKLSEAELALAVFDGSSPLDTEDEAVLAALRDFHGEVICLLNKTENGCAAEGDRFAEAPLRISAATGQGLELLIRRISELYVEEKLDFDRTPVIANARQYAAVTTAKTHLHSALTALEEGFSQDVAGMDLELALGALSELDGRGLSETITDAIFSRFCVGK